MNKLIATTLENKVHLWDLREQHPQEGFASHSYAHDRFIHFLDASCIGNQLIKYSCGYGAYYLSQNGRFWRQFIFVSIIDYKITWYLNVLFSSENGKSTTIWAATHLPQNRDIWATCGGNGSVRKMNLNDMWLKMTYSGAYLEIQLSIIAIWRSNNRERDKRTSRNNRKCWTSSKTNCGDTANQQRWFSSW